MNAIDIIRQWCAANGYSFVYGNPSHVNVWMGETDFSASTDGVCVYAYLLTASEYDGNRDSYNVGIYFATLTDFDFDNTTIDTTTESLKERAKTLLNDLSNGNAVGWSGARFEYGYDDYAENVCWCCLRVTLESLAAECVEYEPTPSGGYPYDIFCPQIIFSDFHMTMGVQSPYYTSDGRVILTIAVSNYVKSANYAPWINAMRTSGWGGANSHVITEAYIQTWKTAMENYNPMTEETEEWLRNHIGYTIFQRSYATDSTVTSPVTVLVADSATNYESKIAYEE